MALVSIAAAKGSPGVTTTALALGALWPRPVVVAETDPAGADIPLRMSSEDGGVLDVDRGLLSLAAAGRKGLGSDLVLAHTQRVLGGLTVLTGVRAPEEAAGMTSVWAMLGPALDGIPGHDVLADCGRIGATTPQTALLRASRLLVLVCTADAGSVVHLRERLAVLTPALDPASPVGTPIAVAVVADPKARDAVRQVRDALARTEVPLKAVWHVAADPRGAGFFNGRVVGRADRTLFIRSLQTVVAEAALIVEPFHVPLPEDRTDAQADATADWQPATAGNEPSAGAPVPTNAPRRGVRDEVTR